MPSFVSCTSKSCKCKQKCGRYLYYTDKNFEGDFLGKKQCSGTKEDVMFLTMRDVRENDMAKKKEKND